MASKSKAFEERTRARESALALLYSSDVTESDVERIIETGSYPAEDFEFPVYAEALVRGVAAHLDEIDRRLASTSENWKVDRMPVVDRAVLRLAVYEMLFEQDVPVSVAINEAVELAKRYGGEDDSSRFVNGVLGRIARSSESADAQPSQAAAEEQGRSVDLPESQASSEDESGDQTVCAEQ